MDSSNIPDPQQKDKTWLVAIIFAAGLIIAAAYALKSEDKDLAQTQMKQSQVAAAKPRIITPPPIAKKIVLESPFPEVKQLYSIDTSYSLTNVERIPFDESKSKLGDAEKKYFSQVFSVTDFLVHERVYNQIIQRSKPDGYSTENYTKAISYLENMDVPEDLKASHEKILGAVKEQKEYFDLMLKTKSQFNANSPFVQTSNKKLISAYQDFIRMFPNEEATNLRSFEKHLCALDFI